MPLSNGFLLGSLLLLILVSAFFSGSETGIMSLNRYRLRHLAQRKHRGARRIQKLLERPDRLLAIILIGNTFANILASAITTVIAGRLWGDAGIAVATIGLTLIILIFSEVAPKTLAALYPQRIAFLAAIPLQIFLWALFPLVWFANAIANGLLKLCKVNVKHTHLEHLSSEELHTVVREAGGLIPVSHQEMLLKILDLGQVTVDEIMVPRNDVVGIDIEEEWHVIVNQLTQSQHNHLPVYSHSIDQVHGMLHIRNAVELLATHKLTKEALLAILHSAYFIPEGTPLNTQLLNFRKEKRRNGFVVDEYGDILGLVTLEDILEEIVGEFTTDTASEHRTIYAQADGSYIIDGAITLRELKRKVGWELPTHGPNTLSGLIIDYLQVIPQSGTSLLLASYPIEVIQVEDNMVKTVKISPRLPLA